VYVANLSGVLEFDGVKWRQITTLNGSAVYNLAVSGAGASPGGVRRAGISGPRRNPHAPLRVALDRLPKALQPLPEIRGTSAVAEVRVRLREPRVPLGRGVRNVREGPSGPSRDAFQKAFS
jgi:hypothetical protein